MTPDQAILLLVKSESKARELFTPDQTAQLMEIASAQLAEAASTLRAAVAVMVAAEKEESDEVREKMQEFSGNLGVMAQLKLATGTTNAMVAFSINPITARAPIDPKADMQ